MKKTKKVISGLLVVAILVLAVPPVASIPVYAAEDELLETLGKIFLIFLAANAFKPAEPEVRIVVPPRPRPPRIKKDPTLGLIENISELWEVEVWFDGAEERIIIPSRPPRKERNGIETNLDIGWHVVQAEAYVDTVFGRRLVGVFNPEGKFNLYVDGRMLDEKYGWKLQLSEWSFQPPDP